MTDTPTHTPLPEPVAWTDADEMKALPDGHALMWPQDSGLAGPDPRPLYSEAQMRALADRAERAERISAELVRDVNEMVAIKNAHQAEHAKTLDRATTAEARLKQAVEVMRPFQAAWNMHHFRGEDPTDYILTTDLERVVTFIEEQTDEQK